MMGPSLLGASGAEMLQGLHLTAASFDAHIRVG